MRQIVCLVAGLIVVAGCGTNVGTNVAGGISLAEARATCLAWDTSPEGPTNFEGFILIAEAFRDDGLREPFYLIGAFETCVNLVDDGFDQAGCEACLIRIGAVVYN